MYITWQGTDITGYVTVKKAAVRNTCGGRCDGLDIEFENAETWYRWGPKEDDKIQIEQDGWESGTLYLNSIAPTDGKYRVIATALPCKARTREWRSYEGRSIEEILRSCAAVTGMDWRVYGIDETAVIPYITQDNEGCAAFLHRLATLENAKLKCVNGRFALIGINWAQERNPIATIRIAPDQDGINYRRNGTKDKGLVLVTPYAKGSATDDAVPDSHAKRRVTAYPAMNDIQANRWARGLLTAKNRTCESLQMNTKFNPALSAMYRVDVEGDTDADGEWIIEDVEHDLINRKSTATLYRCVTSIR